MLVRVERDGAYATVALDAELERCPQLTERDRALATELVYGSLRAHVVLRERLAALAPRGLPAHDPLTLAHLSVAAYQILMLDRVPAHAAVDAAVSAIAARRGPRVGGFANALLRRLAQGPRIDPATAATVSAPEWLRQRLVRAVGEEEALALLRAPESGWLCVRASARHPAPDWLEAAQPGRVSPTARLVRGVGDPRRLPGWGTGGLVIREEGSQLVALALGARPGERVLDACAGRGQKTSLLAEQVGPSGEVWASDLYPGKLRDLEAEFQRLGLTGPRTASVDWTAGPGQIPEGFDRVLVDAPCSGVGTLRRRPEIALRLAEGDPDRLGALGLAVLRGAATRLRPGGRLVYAVCSVLPEECERVVEGVADSLRPVPFDAPDLGAVVPPGATTLRLLPLRHGTDGYFIASLTK